MAQPMNPTSNATKFPSSKTIEAFQLKQKSRYLDFVLITVDHNMITFPLIIKLVSALRIMYIQLDFKLGY